MPTHEAPAEIDLMTSSRKLQPLASFDDADVIASADAPGTRVSFKCSCGRAVSVPTNSATATAGACSRCRDRAQTATNQPESLVRGAAHDAG
jgi:cytochrome c553